MMRKKRAREALTLLFVQLRVAVAARALVRSSRVVRDIMATR